ncbi:MAG: DUF3379 family protein [Woeseiaceae bacterium]
MSADNTDMNSEETNKAFEQKLRRALEIDVPELVMPELPAIETDKVVSLADRRRVATPTWFAIAATVMLAAFIGVRFANNSGVVHDSLADEVLAHVTHEPRALRVTDKAISDKRLYKVVPANIAEMDRSAGLITFANTCPINGHDVPHLVIQGEQGPITILLMPDENIGEAISLNDSESHGVILPVGDGSIAIIGARDEELDEVSKQVLQSVAWTT